MGMGLGFRDRGRVLENRGMIMDDGYVWGWLIVGIELVWLGALVFIGGCLVLQL